MRPDPARAPRTPEGGPAPLPLAPSLFAPYLWAFAYASDLPAVLFPAAPLPWGLAALLAAPVLAAVAARAWWWWSAPRRLALALFALVFSAAVHDAVRVLAGTESASAVMRGVPVALLWAALVHASLWISSGARQALGGHRPRRRRPAGGPSPVSPAAGFGAPPPRTPAATATYKTEGKAP